MNDNMYIEGNCIVIIVDEEVDHHSATIMRKSADSIMNTLEIDNVIFDFTRTRFMDSSGIGLVMGRLRRAKLTGGKVAIINIADNLKRILTMAGLDSMVRICQSKEEAIAYIGGKNNEQ